MLSLGIEKTGATIDIVGLTDPSCTEIEGIEHSEALLRFVDAFMGSDEGALTAARETLVHEIGPEAMVDTVGIASNFQRMVRIADSTGIPPANLGMDDLAEELNDKLGLNEYASSPASRNAP